MQFQIIDTSESTSGFAGCFPLLDGAMAAPRGTTNAGRRNRRSFAFSGPEPENWGSRRVGIQQDCVVSAGFSQDERQGPTLDAVRPSARNSAGAKPRLPDPDALRAPARKRLAPGPGRATECLPR